MTLIERLEAATGPDRELDAEIFELVHGRKPHKSTFEQYEPSEKVPNFTGSIDAARSICKDAFPTFICSVCGKQMVRLIKQTDQPSFEYTGISKTIELAWCIAALRARGVK